MLKEFAKTRPRLQEMLKEQSYLNQCNEKYTKIKYRNNYIEPEIKNTMAVANCHVSINHSKCKWPELVRSGSDKTSSLFHSRNTS